MPARLRLADAPRIGVPHRLATGPHPGATPLLAPPMSARSRLAGTPRIGVARHPSRSLP
ncbi:hypothetical protein [Streptomyces sp. L2]|uniref:hypothetical protein n=1 Tax=Streptomyces sp. L2 TaxID=2162665 RepID=UPI0013E94A19|nr:hypothetical protein [Streptomyces sp. L2]